MKARLHVLVFLALGVCAVGGAAEVETRTHTVSRVQGGLIYTDSDAVFRGDTNTKIVKKTATGEVDAKFTDIKQGDKVEMHFDKGKTNIKKIIIQ